MPTSLTESNVCFDFPDGWTVVKYDEWSFYQSHFQSCGDSSAMDFVVLADDGGDCWLLEVKDFTLQSPNPNKAPLHDILTRKVRDTLAGLLAAAMNASENEKEFAQRVVNAKRIRICFHCERPKHKSRLMASLPDAADLKQKLRKSLRSIDYRVEVVDCIAQSPRVPWTASWQPNTCRSP